MLKGILLRYGVSLLLASALMAYVVTPFTNRLLNRWFRTDIDQRAQLLASAVEQPLAELIARDDQSALQAYLTRVTADERLMAVMLCRQDGTLIYQTVDTPRELSCGNWHPGMPVGVGAANRRYATRLRTGLIEVSPFSFKAADGQSVRMLMVHDLSFIDRRISVTRIYAIALGGLFAGLFALLVGLMTWLLIRRWVHVLVGDIRNLRFLGSDRARAVGSGPVLSKVREVLREIELSQRLEIDFQENWTPQALKQVVREHLGSPQMLAVSNREPYIHTTGSNGPVVQVPASGMVTALQPIMHSCEGTWIAHGSGSADREVVDRYDRVRVPPEDPTYTLRRVWLSTEEEDGYYYGFANEGLWPLCHMVYVRPAFRERDWQQYQRVNQRFADTVLAEARSPNPVVLIQDFHLALLPRLLRERKSEATIALFWHVPWPNPETFGVCPWKREILSALLAADILGFHTRYHCQNFMATVDRYIECQTDHERMTVTLHGHVCQVASYPISIEWPPRWLAHVAAVPAARQAVRARHGIGEQVAIGLGVERWDFTKGILERFQALEALLEHEPRYCGRLSMLQVAAPSRSHLSAYQALQEETRREVQRINARFATGDWKPIVLVDQHQQPEQVFELYRAADFCIVNSLHDGMNLVAKEFVAARDDEDGVLVMSTFAGASRELVEALLVNPFDLQETMHAMRTALEMPREERRTRMRLMRRTVQENNVYRWAGRMLMDAARLRQRQDLHSAVLSRTASVA